MKINYIVNYGVDFTHRNMNSKTFEKYQDALEFYRQILNTPMDTWKVGEILKVESQDKYEPAKLTLKKRLIKHEKRVTYKKPSEEELSGLCA